MRTGFKKTGFILVELIIATAILAAVIPLSKFFIDTIRFAREAKIQQTANHLAQLYMEEYKVIALEDIQNKEETKSVDNRDYEIKIIKTPFLTEGESRNCIGEVHISRESSSQIGVKFKANQFMFLNNEKCLLEATNTLLKLWKNNSQLSSSSISFNDELELDLFVEGNPNFTVEIKNVGDKRLTINRVDIGNNPNFNLMVKHGKVGIRDDVELKDYQSGAHVVVTVKNKGRELAKVSQTRFIEWDKSRV